jgi:hypothetical protein
MGAAMGTVTGPEIIINSCAPAATGAAGRCVFVQKVLQSRVENGQLLPGECREDRRSAG